ncbi:hypothetical protein EXIGLDRAFT_824197 [Exidia glandulosa HHB12029]|uniref:RNA-dependent RNA polymerase n=1 Tax=Exidia glandulosa HHB12029 TaxID=1314781 RepID=A0A166N027_EXIGL|nr:hypothetical protein EXIGLDRAFT_824197 [Exidia glandulosa HHB12029]
MCIVAGSAACSQQQVTRHPCKLPTDVQKVLQAFLSLCLLLTLSQVTAVDHPKLREYRDVMFFSVKGSRSLASLLGGGDYDGDTVNTLWHPDIVTPFQPAPLVHAEVPENFGQWFEKKAKTVEEALTAGEFETSRLQFLLAPLDNTSPPGKFSKLHDIAVYEKGYTHEHTILFAFMFCALLDSAKSGARLLPSSLNTLRRLVTTRRAPAWKETEEERRLAQHEDRPLPKCNTLFIMDEIADTCRKAAQAHLKAFESRVEDVNQFPLTRDIVLVAPWEQARQFAAQAAGFGWDTPKKQLDAIEEHIRVVHREWRAGHATYLIAQQRARRDHVKRAASVTTPMRSPTKKREVLNLDAELPTWSARHQRACYHFACKPAGLGDESFFWGDHALARLKAACAYKLTYDGPDPHKNTDADRTAKFAFQVALRELAALKVESRGGDWKVMGPAFYAQTKTVSM